MELLISSVCLLNLLRWVMKSVQCHFTGIVLKVSMQANRLIAEVSRPKAGHTPIHSLGFNKLYTSANRARVSAGGIFWAHGDGDV